MKDLKLPQLTNEERDNIFKSLNKDDMLYDVEWSIYINRYIIRELKVKNRTPKGFIRLDNADLLKYLPSSYYIPSVEFNNWYRKNKLQEEVLKKMNYLPKETETFIKNLEYEDAVTLKIILNNIFKDVK